MKKPCNPNKSRRFANGGVPDPFASMSMVDMAQYTNDPTALNIAATRDFAAHDAATQGIRGPKTGYQLYSGDPALKDQGIGQRQKVAKPDPLMVAAFADGGKIDPEELMRRMASKYGTTGTQQPSPQPVQQAQAQPAQHQQAQQPQGIIGLLKNRGAQIDKAVNGYANGGKIKGPGTPTSDDIDAEVVETKEPIKVSTGERIVSHAQGQLLEQVAKGIGYKSLDDLLESGTGKPVGPTIKGGKVAAQDGWTVAEDFRNALKNPQSGLSQVAKPFMAAQKSMPDVPLADQQAYAKQESSNTPVGATAAQQAQKPGASLIEAAAQPIDNMRPADLTTKDVLPGGYLDRGAGIVAQRGNNGRLNVTNVGTEGLTDPSKRIVDGSESALIDQKNSTYNPAAQLQRMQALRLTTDATDPSITDPAVRENAIKGLSLIQAAQAGEQNRQVAQLDSQIKKNGLARSAQEQQLIEQMNGKDVTPEQRQVLRQNLLAMQGKNPNEHRYITMPNTKQYNMGQIVGEEQGGVFDTLTGQKVGQQKPTTSKEEVAKAIATGRITKEQAAKRLVDAGLNPKDYGL